tara:strand:- start:120 stop:290 length:171 start_codon:yes stop_codon:yes gene_type:complete
MTFSSIIITNTQGETIFTTGRMDFATEFLAENMLLTIGKMTWVDEYGSEHLVINTL